MSTTDYVGWYDAPENIARGHIMPYFMAGGDQNFDGRLAAVQGTTVVDDLHDACTVYEVNSMPNIAPQYHDLFNGNLGLWYKLETDIRHLVDDGRTFQIVAGTVFVDSPVSMIGRRDRNDSEWAIAVPHGFFRVVIDAPGLAARSAYRHRRCLLPITSFYEWQKTPDGKQPHHIHLMDEELSRLPVCGRSGIA